MIAITIARKDKAPIDQIKNNILNGSLKRVSIDDDGNETVQPCFFDCIKKA